MTAAEWLELYSTPKSVVFNRTPDGWDVLRRLVDEKRIVPTGETDAGGHALFVVADRPYASRAAREAKAGRYGGPSYWAHLDEHAKELAGKGVANAMTRSLSEALSGNDGA